MDATPNPICIGRFSLRLPPGWQVTGRSQQMYLTDLDDVPPAPAAASADPVLDRLRQGLPPQAPLIRRFDLEGVGPAAWFGIGSSDSFERRLVALAGPLRLQLLGAKGREPAGEKALRMIAPGYRPGAHSGFCLARGAMQLDPSRNETTRLALRGDGDWSFTLGTRAVDQPDETHPLARPEAEAASLAGSGVTLTMSPPQPRTVAGLAGREFRGQLQGQGVAPRRLLRYFHPGVGRQAAAPLMTLSLDGPAADAAALDAAWDALLDALAPVAAR